MFKFSGENVRVIRENRGMSVKDVFEKAADLYGAGAVGLTTIYAVEKGRHIPKAHLIGVLKDVLDCSADDFYVNTELHAGFRNTQSFRQIAGEE